MLKLFQKRCCFYVIFKPFQMLIGGLGFPEKQMSKSELGMVEINGKLSSCIECLKFIECLILKMEVEN